MILPAKTLFAVMVLEEDPFRAADLGQGFYNWLQNAGGYAVIGLIILIMAHGLGRLPLERSRPWQPSLFLIAFVISAVLFLVSFAITLATPAPAKANPDAPPATESAQDDTKDKAAAARSPVAEFFASAGGAIAIIGLAIPFGLDLGRLRFRRIWALARVTFKEAIRSQILWIFTALLAVFLFADWFLPHKPENQLRTYVAAVDFVMTILLLLTASLLASFGIPNDLRSQNIHTIVTKPVEKFEIVLGRFLGYTGLITAILVVMTCFSLLYVRIYGINPDAARESMRAREPIYGSLKFRGTDSEKAGVNVGREWDYRSYIAGGPNTPQRAVWEFRDLPASLGNRDRIPCEFAFDIFRTTKGEENKGVFCSLSFQSANFDPDSPDYNQKYLAYQRERQELRNQPDADLWEIDRKLARKHGFYESDLKEVFDYHSYSIDVPADVFKKHQDDYHELAREMRQQGKTPPDMPPLRVSVKCESRTQFLGMAKHDLYLLDAEGSFLLNYFKGAAGLWIRLCLVIGIAVALSTYLSGIISWITTLVIYLTGMIQDFIRTLAEGTGYDKGPVESAYRLVNRESGAAPLDKTATTQAAEASDEVIRWFFRRFLSLLPDVQRFDWVNYVAEGFNIGFGDLCVHLILLGSYLLPWAVLGYYLMKTREVAS